MVSAERSVDESGKAVFIPLCHAWSGESCYCTRFYNHSHGVHVLGVPPEPTDVMVLLRYLFLLVLDGVFFHDVGGAFHLPGDPVAMMFVELELRFCPLGDPDPGFG